MKEEFPFAPAGFFVLRTPLLPFDEFLAWGEGLGAASALGDPERFERVHADDLARLRERLRAALARPFVRDALFVASPNVVERFHLWTDEPETKRGRKVEQVLVRYFSRMAWRATPFGLFAGLSVGTPGSRTRLVVAGRDSYRRHTRLDAHYLHALADALARDPAVRNSLPHRPNSSLYRAAGRVRYVETRLDGEKLSHHLVAVEETDYLTATLERAAHGAKPDDLAAALCGEEVTLDEAREYVAQLIDGQILVPDLAPPLTGPEPVVPLIEQLRGRPETSFAARALEHASEGLSEIDRRGLGVEAEGYHAVARTLESLPAEVELSRLFQVDMFKPASEVTLCGAVLDELMRGVRLLQRLGAHARRDALEQFREAFAARYEEREVPLYEALDEELGVGFGAGQETSPLLRDMPFPSEPAPDATWDARQKFLLRKLDAALRAGAHEINLSPDDLEALREKEPPPLPDSFIVHASLAAASAEAVDAGDFRLRFEAGGGPSGATLFGRFCQADENLRRHVGRLLREEEALRPGAVFAEVVHLPSGRAGNITSRPPLRDYEIVYLGRSGAPPERRLPFTDLLVSVRGGRVRLRSARLGREVVPRLTSAHNFNRPGLLGVYRFLCSLQSQGTLGAFGWDWGALDAAPFLPRLCAGRLVLSLARWLVGQDELRALGEVREAERFAAVQEWRARLRLPRLLTLSDADNRLPVDLDNALSVESFVEEVRGREEAVLTELWPGPGEVFARGAEGRFVHEIQVPFVRQPEGAEASDETRSVRPFPARTPVPQNLPRRFPPGSEWLYAKLYTGAATADRVLLEAVGPFVENVMGACVTDAWFFIRYADPDRHLRLRLHGDPRRLREDALPALHETLAPLLADGRAWRVQLDTYEREVERYGGDAGVTLAERLFQIDSEAVLEILTMLEPGDEGADERWRLALYGVRSLLADLGLDDEAARRMLTRARDGLARELRADKPLLGGLSEKFRRERRNISTLLDPASHDGHPLAPGLEVFRRRSERLSQIVAELRACERAGRLSIPIEELSLSYAHMHCNRLLRSAHRRHELVIYDLLVRLYESRAARVRRV
ncbi:MAG TPA: lantibiotic dehydratase [Pyrinomonadaceae bacterium]|nr:lantibiotic dehydratase [Pyrinomonadaceae bacterium]